VEHTGKHFQISDGRLIYPPVQKPYPPLYFGGSSVQGFKVGVKHIDKYLTWGESPAQVAEKIAVMRRHAEAEGREVSFGIRLHVIVRDTTAEAWAAADKLISKLGDHTIAEAQKVFARMDSVGQARRTALHGGRATSWRSARTCGRASALCGAGRVRRWWAMPIRWPANRRIPPHRGR